MWTNSDFKVWLEEINYSSLSQEALKQVASKFYYKFGDLNKKTVLRCVEDFVKTDKNELTRPSALGMSDPIWGPLIHIFVDEKKN